MYKSFFVVVYAEVHGTILITSFNGRAVSIRLPRFSGECCGVYILGEFESSEHFWLYRIKEEVKICIRNSLLKRNEIE